MTSGCFCSSLPQNDKELGAYSTLKGGGVERGSDPSVIKNELNLCALFPSGRF